MFSVYIFAFIASFYPTALKGFRVNFFSPLLSGWAGGRAVAKSLSGLYLRNHKV